MLAPSVALHHLVVIDFQAWSCPSLCRCGTEAFEAPQALIWDKKFKPFVMEYAADEEKFFKARTPPAVVSQTACACLCIAQSAGRRGSLSAGARPSARRPDRSCLSSIACNRWRAAGSCMGRCRTLRRRSASCWRTACRVGRARGSRRRALPLPIPCMHATRRHKCRATHAHHELAAAGRAAALFGAGQPCLHGQALLRCPHPAILLLSALWRSFRCVASKISGSAPHCHRTKPSTAHTLSGWGSLV